MDPVARFFVENFALLCIVVAMMMIALQNYKTHKEESTFCLLIIGNALLLAVFVYLETYGRENSLLTLATVCSVINYSIRPLCILLFILLAEPKVKKTIYLYIALLVVNFAIYSLALFPFSSQWVFYYTLPVGDEVGLQFHRGTTIVLNFTSHFVSSILLVRLIVVSLKKLKGKHISHGVTILVCALFVVIAVVLETIYSNSYLQLLNTSVAVFILFYYLFLFSERTKSDPLTGLFNREVYYGDLKKMEKTVNAVVQLDMNGLKYINDNFGHYAGDEALRTIAHILENSVRRNMYAYRLGGDEFIVLLTNSHEKEVIELVNRLKNELDKTDYFCSIGYAIKNDKNESLDDLIKRAEKLMYEDKERFYVENRSFERRRPR